MMKRPLVDALLDSAHALADRGFFPKGGVIAQRDDDMIYLTSPGTLLPLAGREDIMAIHISDRNYDFSLYTHIFKERRENKALIIITPPMVMAVTEGAVTLKPLIDESVAILGRKIKSVHPDNRKALTRALRGRKAALLTGRGGLCLGSDLYDAETTALALELLSATEIKSRFLGRGFYLNRLNS